MNLLESTLNLFFPPVCGFCNKLCNSYLCNECYEIVKKQEKNKINKYTNNEFVEHFWIYKYEDIIRKKIIDFKFNEQSYLYRTFVELIMKNDSIIKYISSFDMIVPVPIHKKRYRQRGYNQSELIASTLCKKFENIEYIKDILVKNKNISPQSSLNKEDRKKNVLNVYSVNDKYINKAEVINGKRILLFDDVYTTGSTLNECAKVLKQSFNVIIGTFTIAKD